MLCLTVALPRTGCRDRHLTATNGMAQKWITPAQCPTEPQFSYEYGPPRLLGGKIKSYTIHGRPSKILGHVCHSHRIKIAHVFSHVRFHPSQTYNDL